MSANNVNGMTEEQLKEAYFKLLEQAENQMPTSLNLSKNWPFFLGVIGILYMGFYLWTNDYMAASVASVICGLLLLSYIYILVNTDYTPKVPMYDCPDFFYKNNSGTQCVHVTSGKTFPINPNFTDCQKCKEAKEQNISWQACDINRPCL